MRGYRTTHDAETDWCAEALADGQVAQEVGGLFHIQLQGGVIKIDATHMAEVRGRLDQILTARAAEAARRLEALPDWVLALPTRARNALRWAYIEGEIPGLTKDAVRATGRAYWLRVPNLGKKSIAEIGEAVGGW